TLAMFGYLQKVGSDVGQQPLHCRRIHLGNEASGTQLALTLARLLGKDVVVERVCALETSARGLSEPLGGSTIGLDFRHSPNLRVFDEKARSLYRLGRASSGKRPRLPPRLLSRNYLPFLGESIITICRPSMRGR